MYYVYLGIHLTGKALKTYSSLPEGNLREYELLKDALLQAYQLNADAYGKRFKES